MDDNENIFVNIKNWVIDNIMWEFLSLIISLLVTGGIALYPWDFLNLADQFNDVVVLSFYFFLFFGIIRFIVDIYRFLFQKDNLLPLAEARTEGVKLRNRGENLGNEDDGKLWIDEFDSWDTETTEKISKISKSKGENFKVINRFELTSGFVFTKPQIHNKKLCVLEEKLRRLELLINELEAKRKFNL